MKRLVVLLTVALVLVFTVSALAASSPTIGAKTGVNTTTTTTVAAVPDATLNDDVSKYANNPAAIIADYGIDTFKEPVIFESVTTVGSKTGTLTITQQSLKEGEEVAVFVVYRLNGKLMRVRLNKFNWENGKIVCEIPANVAREIEGKQIRIDVIGEAK